MDPPELTNFGSLVRYALELESASAAFYRAAFRLLGVGPAGSVAQELAEVHEHRHALLERTRQQKLNEMVLEPISGLDGSRYSVDAQVRGAQEIRDQALRLEETAARFYEESSEVAKSLLTEAARTFRKLAGENRGALARIRETFPL